MGGKPQATEESAHLHGDHLHGARLLGGQLHGAQVGGQHLHAQQLTQLWNIWITTNRDSSKE